MKKTLETIKTFYTGTQKELKTNNSLVNFAIFAVETIPALASVACWATGEYGWAAITTPFAIDYTSRFYHGIKNKFQVCPEHTPNVVGQIREYREKKSLEEKLEE